MPLVVMAKFRLKYSLGVSFSLGMALADKGKERSAKA